MLIRLFLFSFYARQHICYCMYVPHANSICPSLYPSCHMRAFVKTAERIIEILSLSDRPIILVFHLQGSLLKSDGFTPNRGAKYKGGSNFRPICGYILERVIDRGIVTMEDEYKVLCALSNAAAFDDLE